HTIKVVAQDTENQISSDIIVVTVQNQAPNQPPQITITSPHDGDTVTGIITITVDANDDKGIEEVRFFAGITEIGSSSTAPYSLVWDTTNLPNGIYDLQARIRDTGGLTSGDTIQINVQNEISTQPLVLSFIGDRSVDENDLLEFTISATDPDGNELTYSASNLPEGASFDEITRTFSWTPTDQQSGVHENVHFEVTDGELTDSEDITIIVNDVDQPPEQTLQKEVPVKLIPGHSEPGEISPVKEEKNIADSPETKPKSKTRTFISGSYAGHINEYKQVIKHYIRSKNKSLISGQVHHQQRYDALVEKYLQKTRIIENWPNLR
ncbi:MAG: hypothetical protein KKG01_02545, partial [Candidatus Omnitrophica bacterium]|nr:hypothetical protein [Candidatus Omnitrophota bacterium]